MEIKLDENIERRAAAVRLMIFDVDGVMTDGSIIYHDDGSETKIFDVKDGHGIKLALRAGLDIALITGRYSRVVEHRAADLGIKIVYQNVHRKLDAYQKILEESGLKDYQVGYMGDDLIDIPVMRRVGFAVAVRDACPHIFPFAHYITKACGGKGACREVCELLLRAHGKWEGVTKRYFEDSL